MLYKTLVTSLRSSSTKIIKRSYHKSKLLNKNNILCNQLYRYRKSKFSSTESAGQGGGYLQTGHGSPSNPSSKILVTGASGQIGSELIPHLRGIFGKDNIISSDVKTTHIGPNSKNRLSLQDGPFIYMDVTDKDQIARVVLEHGIDMILHLAALLSATGEQNPKLAIKINNVGVENVLEIAKDNNVQVYIPSSIAAFGPTTPQDNTPNLTIQRPTTIYGITKVYSELLGEYYCNRYKVDYRALRYPGIISSKSMPGGGTTDYAVEIYHAALKQGKYTCFLKEDAMLPMLYMPDCIKATIQLLLADNKKLKSRVYNVNGMSFTPKQLADSIRKFIPNFKLECKPDFRQKIAESWPRSLDDSEAKNDWDWKPDYDIDAMTEDMLNYLSTKYNK